MLLFKTPYSWRYKIAEIYSYIFCYSIWIICGIKFKITGAEILKQTNAPYVAVANHQSFWDNFFMQIIIPRHSWVIKRELMDIPVFGWGLKIVEPIAVDRSDMLSVSKILKIGSKNIEEGNSMVIFPEGTRIKVGRDVKYKPSAAKLAKKNKAGMLLIALNSGNVWPKGFWFKKSGTIDIKILEYINATRVDEYDDARELSYYIQEKITKAKNLLN